MFQRLVQYFRPDRGLFRYWDGRRWRSADADAAWRKVFTPELLSDAAVARNPPKQDGTRFYPAEEVHAAEDRLRDMTREVFDVKEWKENQPGLTIGETDDLLNRFFDYCADLKKKRSASQMRSAPLESTEPASCSDTENCPAGAAPDYSCSPTESTAAAPTAP